MELKTPVEQEEMLLNGDQAVAWALYHVEPDVVAAYPITPQTIIVEKFSEFVADGLVRTEFVSVESEHSALSAVVGAAAAGARAFTATASQGLALMNEILHIASSLRLPIVMSIATRALSAPINIHPDHGDIMNSREAGWIILFSENAQEVYDSVIQAFKIAEDHRVLLPVMVAFDGFVISHTAERVYVFKDVKVVRDIFLGGPRKVPKIKLMGKEVELALRPLSHTPVPLTIGPLDLTDFYFEHKVQHMDALYKSIDVVKEVHDEYAKLTGRTYGNGVIEKYKLDDAEIALVAMGATVGTLRYVVDELREEGYKVGLLKIRLYRPFPTEEIVEALKNAKIVGVFDRAAPNGAVGAPLFLDIRSALYELDKRPIVVDYVYGLGGRDTPPELFKEAVDELQGILKGTVKPFKFRYLGVRE